VDIFNQVSLVIIHIFQDFRKNILHDPDMNTPRIPYIFGGDADLPKENPHV